MQLPNDLYSFLSDLQQNKNRDWFTNHKLRFKSIETQVKAFGEQLKDYFNHHDHIDRFKLFRIYRDVRFSKDKTPYKTHFGLTWHRTKPLYRGGGGITCIFRLEITFWHVAFGTPTQQT